MALLFLSSLLLSTSMVTSTQQRKPQHHHHPHHHHHHDFADHIHNNVKSILEKHLHGLKSTNIHSKNFKDLKQHKKVFEKLDDLKKRAENQLEIHVSGKAEYIKPPTPIIPVAPPSSSVLEIKTKSKTETTITKKY